MIQNLTDSDSLIHVSIQHKPDEVDALLAHDVWHAQVVVHDLVDAVERVLLVHDRVEQDSQRPYVLLLAAVRLASQNFRCSVIYSRTD